MRVTNPRLLGVFGALIIGAAATLSLKSKDVPTSLPPALDYNREINLGCQEIGTITSAFVTLRNRGGEPLVVDQIQSSCVCAGLETETANGYEGFAQLILPPGDARRLRVRISVSGPVGQPVTTVVTFRTNDPLQPEGRIAVFVPKTTGGLRTDPKVVTFGTVQFGMDTDREVTIYDDALPPRTIQRVAAFPPELFSAEFIAVDRDGAIVDSPRSNLLGHLRIRHRATTLGRIDGRVEVCLKGQDRAPDIIPISALVIGPVVVSPSRLSLPLRAADGSRVYRATCMCSTRDNESFSLGIASCPDGLVATVCPAEGGQVQKRVTIELAAGAVPSGRAETRTILLTATIGKKTAMVEIPVLCRGIDP